MAIAKGLTRIVEEAIVAQIQTDTNIVTEVSDRFFYNRFSPRYVFPLIVVDDGSQILERKTHGGSDGHDDRIMSFAVYVVTKSNDDEQAQNDCKDLADAVFNTLRFTSLAGDGVLFYPLDIESYEPTSMESTNGYLWSAAIGIRGKIRYTRQ